jgi:hypothetical protein
MQNKSAMSSDAPSRSLVINQPYKHGSTTYAATAPNTTPFNQGLTFGKKLIKQHGGHRHNVSLTANSPGNRAVAGFVIQEPCVTPAMQKVSHTVCEKTRI